MLSALFVLLDGNHRWIHITNGVEFWFLYMSAWTICLTVFPPVRDDVTPLWRRIAVLLMPYNMVFEGSHWPSSKRILFVGCCKGSWKTLKFLYILSVIFRQVSRTFNTFSLTKYFVMAGGAFALGWWNATKQWTQLLYVPNMRDIPCDTVVCVTFRLERD